MNIIKLINKIKNNFNDNIKIYRYKKKHFGKQIAFGALKSLLVAFLPIKNKNEYYKKQDKIIYNFLIDKYKYVIDKYNSIDTINEKINKKYIWVFWYQGLDCAPVIVKKCINSIKKHCSDYEVVILNKDNIYKYIDIPQIILDKIDKKIITLTHFSDILRMGLLSKYGGIWCDATCYITKDIFNKFNDVNFNTCIVRDNKWTGFFIGGSSNILFKFCYEFLLEYNKKEDCLISYFLIDRTIEIAYNEVYSCKRLIDSATIENKNILKFEQEFDCIYEKKNYDKLITLSPVYKLTYKKNFKTSIDGKMTNYGHFIEKK